MAHCPLVAPAPPGPAAQPGEQPPAVAAPPDDGTSREGSLDVLLRFRGGESPAGVLESDFTAALARTMRLSRTICLVFLAVAYAVSVAVYAADRLPMRNNWAYLCVSVLSLALIPGVRAARARVAEVAATTATSLVLFAFDFDGPGGATQPCTSGEYVPLMLYGSLPLLTGVTFAPRWRVYGAMCVAHVARAAVQLAPLGPTPALLVFFVSVLGGILLYLHERRARFHFVRACVHLPTCRVRVTRRVVHCSNSTPAPRRSRSGRSSRVRNASSSRSGTYVRGAVRCACAHTISCSFDL